MSETITVGLDLAQNVFQVHGTNTFLSASGQNVIADAGLEMIGAYLAQFGYAQGAIRYGVRATCAKDATAWGMNRVRDFPGQDDALALTIGVGNWCRRK